MREKRSRYEVMYNDSKKSRSKAVKYFCWQCCGYGSVSVEGCTSKNCPLYPFRSGISREISKLIDETRPQAVKRYCKICIDGNPKKKCKIGQISKSNKNGCPLYVWK